MKKLFLSLLAVAALCACSNKEQVPSGVNPAAGTAIRFATQTYTLKSSDEGLDNGDKLGIFASNYVTAENVEATVSGSDLTLAQTIYWGKDQKDNEETDFIAYYPYMDGVKLNTPFTFTVQADQSSAAAYQASDFMAGGTSKAPQNKPVVLPLEHRFSKVVVKVDNKVAGETVKSVALDKMVIAAELNIGAHTITPSATEAVQIALRPDATKDDFELIVLPQQAQPQLVVTMQSGKTYTFSLAATADFKAGKKATAEVSITSTEPSVNPVSFSFSVKNWEDDTDALAFDNPVEGQEDNDYKWSIIGLYNDWDNDIYLTKVENEETWQILNFEVTAASSFKFRFNHSWDETESQYTYNDGPGKGNLGGAFAANADIPLEIDGANISIAVGKYNIYLHPMEKTAYIQVLEGGEDPNVWRVVGLNGDWDASNGVVMTKGTSAVSGLEEWVATIAYNPATDGYGFKIVLNDWDNYFGYDGGNLDVSTDYYLVGKAVNDNPGNIIVNVAEPVNLILYFQPSDGHIWIAPVADPVDPTSSADLYVVNTHGWASPAIWAWGANIAMPGAWPNGLEPEAGTVEVGGKEYIHFVLDGTYMGIGIGFLVLDKTTGVQTADVTNITIQNGDKLYYEIGAENGGKYEIAPVQ